MLLSPAVSFVLLSCLQMRPLSYGQNADSAGRSFSGQHNIQHSVLAFYILMSFYELISLSTRKFETIKISAFYEINERYCLYFLSRHDRFVYPPEIWQTDCASNRHIWKEMNYQTRFFLLDIAWVRLTIGEISWLEISSFLPYATLQWCNKFLHSGKRIGRSIRLSS